MGTAWFWDHFDRKGWSLWRGVFRNPQSLGLVSKSADLMRAFFRTLVGIQSYKSTWESTRKSLNMSEKAAPPAALLDEVAKGPSGLKKTTTVDKSAPIVKAEGDDKAEKVVGN